MVFPTFYWSSLVIPILMLFPNFLCFLFPPINTPQFKEKNEPLILLILEIIGRIGVTVIPVFYPIILNNNTSYFYLTCLLLLLFFYYACWLRFFRFARNYAALFLPMGHIPIPMAFSPVLFFVVSAANSTHFLCLSRLYYWPLGIYHSAIENTSESLIKNYSYRTKTSVRHNKYLI